MKPAVLKKIDQHQYGTIPKSSSTHALISMMHRLYVSTDGNGATNRGVLFDFRKAFDLINQDIPLEKLLMYDILGQVVCWILDFLTFRRQRTKLATDCSSEWRYVPSGVTQGTKLGPWFFLSMVNDARNAGFLVSLIDVMQDKLHTVPLLSLLSPPPGSCLGRLEG